MWHKQFSKVYTEIAVEDVWLEWTNINCWPQWNSQIEYSTLNSNFSVGCKYVIKRHHLPKLKMTLVQIEAPHQFSDRTHLFGATMTCSYEVISTPEGVKISHTISMTGPLSGWWILIVGNKIANHLATESEDLVKYVKSIYG